MRNSQPSARRDLVLVGGGHSHVQVLRRFAMEPPPDLRLTVIVDTPIAIYSGMVPGFVAGQYAAPELEIDVVPLARRAGARIVLSRAVGVDAGAGRIAVEGRAPIHYDVASFDIGSTVGGLELPGVREHALPTRPIGRFVGRVDAALERVAAKATGEPVRVVIVGAGVGGVELAFTLDQRLRGLGIADRRISLLDQAPRILPGFPAGLAARAERHAARRGIEIRLGVRVAAADDDGVRLADGSTVPFDLLIWVTGALGHSLMRDSGLATDEGGFVLTRSTLQVRDHDNLFAVGDCAALIEHAAIAKAGVYAVRSGPVLIDNLRASLAGVDLRRYTPQRDFLALLNLGDGTALGSKWGRSFEGRWVMEWKDWIDRRFMRKFQVLAEDGEPTADFPEMAEGMEMLCGGCAAKVGQSVLDRALARLAAERPAAPGSSSGAADPSVVLSLDRADDAAAVRTPRGDLLASTIDVFSAFTDDPWLVGKVAAINATSDLLATGVQPRYALALVAVPESSEPDEAEEILYQTLAGARAALDELGVTLLGGHTTTAAKLMVGFSVDGFAEDEGALLRLDRLRAGQELVLTKALGTGVLFHADMRALARGPWLEAALRSVTRSNARALGVLRAAGVEAVTDVTGFGLVGHLGEMLRASGLSARLRVADLPALPGSVELLGRGLRSTFHAENERARRGIVVGAEAARDPRLPLLFDPQTAGGLLLGVDREGAAALVEQLRALGPAAAIGETIARRPDGALIEVV